MRLLSSGLLSVALALAAPLQSGDVTTVDGVVVTSEPGMHVLPVLWESPGCDHDKLGSVEITLGEHVSEITRDPNVPTVEYGRAVARLVKAAGEKGANAVVLRAHQGVYFTYNGKRSRKPVYVKLRGAAIHLPPEALAQCPLKLASVAELEDLSRRKPEQAYARDVFAED